VYITQLHTPNLCQACAVFFAKGDRAKKHGLVASVGIAIIVSFVYIAVKHGEPNEKANTDEVFHTFDV
jgi:hypothetical protein